MNTFYVIKDGFCWKYHDQRIVTNYPKHVTEEWPGVPVFLDEAYYDNGKIHFVEKNNIWIYENERVQKMNLLLEMEMDAVTTMGNRLYFFKGTQQFVVSFRDRLIGCDCRFEVLEVRYIPYGDGTSKWIPKSD